MKIGIIETGKLPPDLLDRHGPYETMFGRMVHKVDPTIEIINRDVVDAGDIPASPHEADGWIITGSKHGVYDPLPWIEPLKDFLRAAHAAKVPMVGVCFGHQILAEALGGKVVKSDRGWGAGVHTYDIDAREAWMSGDRATIDIHAMHQDQVVEKPADARVIASSDFCEYAGLAYGDHAISMQPHPEFDAAFQGDIITVRRGSVIPKEIADQALSTLPNGVDNDLVGTWIVDFLRHATQQKSA